MNEDSQKKLVSSLFHNSSKDSNLDLKAINSHDLIDFSEVTSDDDVKKIKNKSKKNKNNEKSEKKERKEKNEKKEKIIKKERGFDEEEKDEEKEEHDKNVNEDT